MGVSVKQTQQNRGRRRRSRSHTMMSEINVTPMVDVMLVLLIIFMVAAPLLTVGVPIELPESQGQQLESTSSDPLTISVARDGGVYIGETKVELDELSDKLRAITKNRLDEQIYVRGDKGINYGRVMLVMGRINAGGFKKVSLITEVEGGG
jgi:biopolymer transport protein TolR